MLSLFTQGLAGRYLHLRPVEALTGEFRPETATTDGTAIYLPGAVTLFQERAHNLGVSSTSRTSPARSERLDGIPSEAMDATSASVHNPAS